MNKAEVGHKPDYMSGNLDYLDIVLLDYDLSVSIVVCPLFRYLEVSSCLFGF